MRLLVVGPPGGRLTLAARLAAQNGADIVRADGVAGALRLLGSGASIDCILADAGIAIRDLVNGARSSSRSPPLIACGTSPDVITARAAIDAGANEYLPISDSTEEIAAVLAALAREERDLPWATASKRH